MPRKAPPPARRAERLPSAHGGMSRFAYARAKSAGVALDPIIKQAGLTRQQLDDPHATIAVRDQIKFLNLAAEALQDDLLGFHIAQIPDLRAFGLLYYLLASSETLLDGLQRIARYSTIVNEGVAQTCTHGTELCVSFRYQGVSRHLDRHQIECWTAGLVRMCRELTGLRSFPRACGLSTSGAKIKGPSCRSSSARPSSSARRSMMSRSHATPRKRGSSARTPT